MGPEAFDRAVTTSAPGELPLRVQLTNDTWGRLPGVALMVGLAGLIVAPQLALAIYALGASELRQAVVAAPWIGVELAIGLISLIGLVCWPLRLRVARLARRRDIVINRDHVVVTDHHAFGETPWSASMSEFAGVTHHVRSSLSGVRHELVLVHPERGRSLILRVSEQIPGRDLDAVRGLLLMPEVAALALYQSQRATPRAGANRLTTAIPAARAA